MIDWASDTFKALIAAVALWIAAYVRKKIVPLAKALHKITMVVERVDKLDTKVSEMDARQLALIQTDPNPVFVTDVKGNLIDVNMSWLAMTGFSDIEHARGKSYIQAIPDDFVPTLEKLSERFEKSESSFEGLIPFKNIKTGQRIETICRSEPMYDLNKVFIGTIGRLLILNK